MINIILSNIMAILLMNQNEFFFCPINDGSSLGNSSHTITNK